MEANYTVADVERPYSSWIEESFKMKSCDPEILIQHGEKFAKLRGFTLSKSCNYKKIDDAGQVQDGEGVDAKKREDKKVMIRGRLLCTYCKTFEIGFTSEKKNNERVYFFKTLDIEHGNERCLTRNIPSRLGEDVLINSERDVSEEEMEYFMKFGPYCGQC